MDTTSKYVLKGVSLTLLAAMFSVFGLVIANTQNLIAGIFIIIGSAVFWGYACLLTLFAELRRKRRS